VKLLNYERLIETKNQYTIYTYPASISIPTIGVREVLLKDIKATTIYNAALELLEKQKHIDMINEEIENYRNIVEKKYPSIYDVEDTDLSAAT